MNRFFALMLVVISMQGVAQQPETAAFPTEQFESARSTWQNAAIDRYEYGYNKFCECHAETPPETIVSVEQTVVTDVRHRMFKTGDIVPADPKNFDLYWTVDDLFALLERAAEAAAIVRADFDPLSGVPRSIFIDYQPDLIGDEVDVRITRFEVR